MIRILHLSDPHFGAADADIARAFIARAAGMQPDLTIVSGDLSMRARRIELKAAAAFLRQLPEPWIVIPGNHDIPAINHPYDRFFRPYRRYRHWIREDVEPAFVNDGADVLCLNSTRAFGFHTDWSDGRLSSGQLARISEHFAETPPQRLRVLVIHHPVLELQGSVRSVVQPLAGLMSALEQGRVDLLLCGHFHRSQVTCGSASGRWGTLVSQAPTVCSMRLQGEPQGFHEIVVSEDGAELIHHVMDRGDFVARSVYPFRKTDTGWESRAAL